MKNHTKANSGTNNSSDAEPDTMSPTPGQKGDEQYFSCNDKSFCGGIDFGLDDDSKITLKVTNLNETQDSLVREL